MIPLSCCLEHFYVILSNTFFLYNGKIMDIWSFSNLSCFGAPMQLSITEHDMGKAQDSTWTSFVNTWHLCDTANKTILTFSDNFHNS